MFLSRYITITFIPLHFTLIKKKIPLEFIVFQGVNSFIPPQLTANFYAFLAN